MSRYNLFFICYCLIAVFTAREKVSADIITPPADTAQTIYFIGISAPKSDKQEALKDAEKDARIRVSGYIAFMIEEKVEDAAVFIKSNGQVIENTERALIATSSYTRAILGEVKIVGEPRITTYRNGTVETQLVVAVDRKLLNKAIDDFNRLRDAVSTMRFTDGPSTYTIQKGAGIEISVGIGANTSVNIGAIECVFTYGSVREAQSLTLANAVNFHVDTAHLPVGKSTGVFELQLDKLSPGMVNVRRTVVLEVTPLNTIRIALLNEDAKNIAPKIRDIMQKQGLLLVESGGAYLATVELSLNERQTNSYFIVEPTVTINIELERDGTPLVTYTKKYGEFRHVTRNEALARAYRNIENDLGGNFAEQVRGMGK
jgi:hypothetical protein